MQSLYMTRTKLRPRGPLPNRPPTQRCDSSSSHSAGTSSIFVFRPIYAVVNGLSVVVHSSAACRTSSTRFSVVGPFAARSITLCVCCTPFNIPSTSSQSWWASSAQGCICAEMICAFLHSSLICPYKSVPS